MRWQAAVVLIAVLTGVIVPPALPVMTGHEARYEFGSLDVCHRSTPAIAANGDMPCMVAWSCVAPPPFQAGAAVPDVPLMNELILPCRTEQPPRS